MAHSTPPSKGKMWWITENSGSWCYLSWLLWLNCLFLCQLCPVQSSPEVDTFPPSLVHGLFHRLFFTKKDGKTLYFHASWEARPKTPQKAVFSIVFRYSPARQERICDTAPSLKVTWHRKVTIITLFEWSPPWHSLWYSIWHSLWYSIWHSIWNSISHIFWHSIWHSIWHIFWHSIWHIFWHSISHSIWHIFCHSIWHIYLASLLPFYLAYLSAIYLAYPL